MFGALAGLLVAGAALRVAVMVAVPPALLGHPDSYFYMGAGADHLFSDPGHTAGYAAFLRVLHAVDPTLFAVAFTQHVLGLITGLLLFLTLRRAGLRSWAALLPTAVMALSGPVVLLEQALLSETLFMVLQAGALYAAVSGVTGRRVPWLATSGVLAGLAVLVRPVALILVAAIVVWVLVVLREGLARRAAPAAAVGLAAALVVGGYSVVQRHETGRSGLVQASGWYAYARAAPFADCREFMPPDGTRGLCQTLDPSLRPGPNDYIFDARSPAVRAYGSPHTSSSAANAKLASFGRAAIVHQPMDWLAQVATEELPRFVVSKRQVREDQGMDYATLAKTLTTSPTPEMAARAGEIYTDAPTPGWRHGLGVLGGYERLTRVDGVVSAILMLLGLAGAWLGRGLPRAVAALCLAVAVGSMVGSVLSLFYDARYAIAAWGPMAAAAGIGAGVLGERLPWRPTRVST